MKILDPWRGILRPLIPRGFLRRDQGDGLFISDYPRHGEEERVTRAIESAGFTVSIDNGLARIDGTRDTYEALLGNCQAFAVLKSSEENSYLYALAQRLARTQTPWAQQPLAPIRLVLKCLDAEEFHTLEEKLPPMIAFLQREHQPLPAAAGILLLLALKEKGENAC